MADYTRQSVFIPGDLIKAEHGNAEFNQLVAFASQTGGHKHDGTAAEGAYIPLISDTTNEDKVEIVTGGAKTTGTHQVTGLLTADASVAVTGNITVTGTVDGRDVATDGTSLDGVIAGTVLTASDIINTPAGTIAAVEIQAAVNELDIEKAALAGATFTGNITVPNLVTTGDVDGRDVSVDGTKLDGIESGATADQSNSEIKIAYEANADTNEFSDAEQTKLLGIETAATADQNASEVVFTPAGSISSATVQLALQEVDTEKVSRVDGDKRYSPTFATVAEMVVANPVSIDGEVVTLVAGMMVSTQGYFAAGDAGSAEYFIVASQAADEQGDHTASNGTVAVLQNPVKAELNVLQFGAKGIGTSFDDSPAFAAAFAAAPIGNTVFAPTTSVYYWVGDVELPQNVNFKGNAKVRVYNPFTSADADMTGVGAVVFNTAKTNPMSFAGTNRVSNMNFHGSDKSKNGISNTLSSVGGLFFERVSMTNYALAYGTTNTINNSRFLLCHAAQNIIGFRNLVDSHVTNAEVNANATGISSQTGANDTTYLGCKVEFNTVNNWHFFESFNNMVIGGVCDRAGEAGFKLQVCGVQIVGVMTRRNGRFNLGADENAHYFIEGSTSKIIIVAPQTAIGADDGGGGDTTPTYSVSLRGSQTGKLVITGGDLSGAVTTPYSAFTDATETIIDNVIGIDSIINVGSFQRTGGRQAQHFLSVANLVNTASEAFTGLEDVVLNTFSRRLREIKMVTRNASTGGSLAGSLFFIQIREGGSASVFVYPAYFESVANQFGDTGSDAVQVTFSNIAADFSTYDLTVTNNGGGHTYTISLEVL